LAAASRAIERETTMDGNPVPNAEEFSPLVKQRTAPHAASSADLVKYVLVELDVLSKDHQAFQHAMIDFVELMFDHKRWELVFASYPMTGTLNRFVHIWKIPDESDILDIMREGAFDRGAPPAKDAESLAEKFRECYLKVQALIQRTKHTLMTSLPYDPEHVGFQSQTILIDADDEVFIIDHAKLRANAKELDTSKKLEKVRQTQFARRLRSQTKVPAHPNCQGEIADIEKAGKLELLKEVQNHLNRGTPVARLKSYDGQALLFNLAGLKPKSVFQPATPLPNTDSPNLVLGRASRGNGQVDLSVKRILLAMPWGGVYNLEQDDVRKLATPIPDDQKEATKQALAPIRDGAAPLAAIPEERDNIIGDGCACFVINLRSFVR
jgi:hypothetical protein